MKSLESTTRREFLKKLLGFGIKTTVAGTIVGSALLTQAEIDSYKIEDSETDSDPVEKQIQENDKEELIIDKKICEVPLKLYGITHRRASAESAYNRLEDFIKKSSVVVAEGNPNDLKDPSVFNDFKAYFGTVYKLCQKYDKPIVSLDPLSRTGMLSEALIGFVGGIYSIENASKLSEYIKSERLDKRELITAGFKILAGYYLFMGSLPLSLALKNLFYDDIIKMEKHEHYYFSHIIDQRNVTITNRLLDLPSMLEKKDLERGDYMLVIFGEGHIAGVNHYLDHNIQRRFKSHVYKCIYDLVDSDSIVKFIPNDGSWKKTILKK